MRETGSWGSFDLRKLPVCKFGLVSRGGLSKLSDLRTFFACFEILDFGSTLIGFLGKQSFCWLPASPFNSCYNVPDFKTFELRFWQSEEVAK